MKRVTRNQTVIHLGPDLKPVMTINSGERVIVETRTGPNVYPLEETLHRLDMKKAMPLSGPVGVQGAHPGDLLAAEIIDIQLADRGVSLIDRRFGILNVEIPEEFNRVTQIKDGFVKYSDEIRIPIKPMIGCISAAPMEEQARGNPGNHGANLDLIEIQTGSIVYLPVFIEDAQLVLGNVHAVMGEGVITGLGLEIEAQVTLELTVIRGSDLHHPLIETPKHVVIPGYGFPLEEAIKLASLRAIEFLMRALDLKRVEAYSLISLACDVRLGSIVNEVNSVAIRIPKQLLSESYERVFEVH
jgi:amidase